MALVVVNPELDAIRRLGRIFVIHCFRTPPSMLERAKVCVWCGSADMNRLGPHTLEFDGFPDNYEFGPDGIGTTLKGAFPSRQPRIKCSAIYGKAQETQE